MSHLSAVFAVFKSKYGRKKWSLHKSIVWPWVYIVHELCEELLWWYFSCSKAWQLQFSLTVIIRKKMESIWPKNSILVVHRSRKVMWVWRQHDNKDKTFIFGWTNPLGIWLVFAVCLWTHESSQAYYSHSSQAPASCVSLMWKGKRDKLPPGEG